MLSSRTAGMGRTVQLHTGRILSYALLGGGLAGMTSWRAPEAVALARIIEGETALRQGEPHTAIERFELAKEQADSCLARYGLGRAYLETEVFAEAHSEFDRCFNRRGEATATNQIQIPDQWVAARMSATLQTHETEGGMPHSRIAIVLLVLTTGARGSHAAALNLSIGDDRPRS